MRRIWLEIEVAMRKPFYWLEGPALVTILSLQLIRWFG